MKWYYRPWVVLLLLFLVLGPFGLPLVYKSPAFNRPWKIFLTVLTLAYTLYFVAVTFETMYRSVRPLLNYETITPNRS